MTHDEMIVHVEHIVHSRLIEPGQKIQSKRTGKTLLCYNVMPCYVGQSIKHWEYSFWDADKKICKTVHHRVLKEWLNGVWSVVVKEVE